MVTSKTALNQNLEEPVETSRTGVDEGNKTSNVTNNLPTTAFSMVFSSSRLKLEEFAQDSMVR